MENDGPDTVPSVRADELPLTQKYSKEWRVVGREPHRTDPVEGGKR
jgi:hypothetical protein